MLTFPKQRSQSDLLADEASISSGLVTPAGEDRTRQEFKQETDVNYILSRFGVGPQPQRQTIYTEVDYDLDLQTAVSARQAAEEAYRGMPVTLRNKYRSIDDVLNGIASGQFRIDLSRANDPPPPDTDPVP